MVVYGDMDTGAKIEILRTLAGVSRAQLASELGCTVAAVSNWENGGNRPTTARLKRIADLAHVSVDYLLDASDERTVDRLRFEARCRDVIARIGWEVAFSRLILGPEDVAAQKTAYTRERGSIPTGGQHDPG